MDEFYNKDERVEDPIFRPRVLYDMEWLRNGELLTRPAGPEPLVLVDDPHRAVLVTSISKVDQQDHPSWTSDQLMHLPCFDLDIPFEDIRVMRSASGHAHLYINQEVPWNRLCDLMDSMVDAGLLEAGYAKACKAQGMMRLRMPGIPKINMTWVGYKGE